MVHGDTTEHQLRWPTTANVALAMVVPTGMELLLISFAGGPWHGAEIGAVYDMVTVVISALVGAVFLFRGRARFAGWIVLLYLPMMLFGLFWLMVGAHCGMHGNCL